MDPYEFTQTIHDESHEDSIDDVKQLEQELAPSSADYYGVLNVSRKVGINHTTPWGHLIDLYPNRLQRKKLRRLTKSCVVSFILTR